MAAKVVGIVNNSVDPGTGVTVTLPSLGGKNSTIKRTAAVGGTSYLLGDYANGYFVIPSATSSPNLFYSPNSVGPWYTTDTGTGALVYLVKYINNYWVAVHGSGLVTYSTSPTGPWSSGTTLPGTSQPRTVTFANNYWVVTSASGDLWYLNSSGAPVGTWVANSPTYSAYNVKAAYGNGWWVISGYASSNSQAVWYQQTVPTGVWTQSTSFTPSEVVTPSYINNYWILVGAASLWYRANDPLGAFTANLNAWASGTNDGITYGNNTYIIRGASSFTYRLNDFFGAFTDVSTSTVGDNLIYSTNTQTTDGLGNWISSSRDALIAYDSTTPSILLAAVYVRGGSGNAISTPTGWTALGAQANNGTTLGARLFWKVRDGTEGSSVTFNWATSNKGIAHVYLISGVSKNLLDSSLYGASVNTASANITIPALNGFPGNNISGINLIIGGTAVTDTAYSNPAPTGFGLASVTDTIAGGNTTNITVDSSHTIVSNVSSLPSLTWTFGTSALNIGQQILIPSYIQYTGYAQARTRIFVSNFVPANANALIGRFDNLYSAINDVIPDDTTVILGNTGANATVQLDTDARTPQWPIDHYLIYRAKTSGSFTITLFSDSNQILQQTVSGIPSFTTSSIKLTAGQISSITNYSNLSVQFVAVSGQSEISYIYLQTPPEGLTTRNRLAQANARIVYTYFQNSQAQAQLILVPQVTGLVQASIIYPAYPSGYQSTNTGTGANSITFSRSPAYSWSNTSISNTTQNLNKVATRDGLWVAVGANGSSIWTTTPAGSWNTITSITSNTLNDVTFGNGLWVTVGDSSTILYTNNPSNGWTATSLGYSANLKSIYYDVNTQTWVATSEFGYIYATQNILSTWTQIWTGTYGTINGIVYGNTYWVGITSNNSVVVSSTGLSGNWSESPVDTNLTSNNILGIAITKNTWVITGGTPGAGTSYWASYSPFSWTSIGSKASGYMQRDVILGGRFWVSAGDYGYGIETSNLYFSPQTLGITSGGNINGLAYDKNTYVAVGDGGRITTIYIIDADALVLAVAARTDISNFTADSGNVTLIQSSNNGNPASLTTNTYWISGTNENAIQIFFGSTVKAAAILVGFKNAVPNFPVAEEYAYQTSTGNTVNYPSLMFSEYKQGIALAIGTYGDLDSEIIPSTYTSLVSDYTSNEDSSNINVTIDASVSPTFISDISDLPATTSYWIGNPADNSGQHILIKTASGTGVAGVTKKTVARKFAQARYAFKAIGVKAPAQAKTSIKTFYSTSGLANAQIKSHPNAYAQAAVYIRLRSYRPAQALGTILTFNNNTFGQALADILTFDNGQSGQAQADIQATYQVYGQTNTYITGINYPTGNALAQIKLVRFASGYANADIKQTYSIFANSSVWIKVTNNLANANANTYIKSIANNTYGQAIADVLSPGFGSAYVLADIKTNYVKFGQSLVDIKAVYQIYAQATATITGKVFGQASVWICRTESSIGQSFTRILVIGNNVFAQANFRSRRTENSYAIASVWIRRTEAQQAITIGTILTLNNNQSGLAQVQIAPVRYAQGLAITNILATSQGNASSNAAIILIQKINSNALADIKTQYSEIANAYGLIATRDNSVQAQASVRILSEKITQTGQSIAEILTEGNACGQALADIITSYVTFGQAFSDIKTTYQQNAQASAVVQGNVFGQSAGYILTTPYVTGQSQTYILLTQYCYGQSLGTILATTNIVGQSLADILATTIQFGNANANLVQTSFVSSTVQSNIVRTESISSQALTAILATTSQTANSNADILQTINQYGQSTSNIILVNQASSQAIADITQTYEQFGNAEAWILTTDVSSIGSALADILSLSNNVYGQSLSEIVNRGYGYSFAQTDILTNYVAYGQSLADIQTTYLGHGLAQTAIVGTAFGQTQTDIKTTYVVYASAQTDILATDSGTGLAHVYIKSDKVNTYGQSLGTILQTYSEYGQAHVDIQATYTTYGQADVWIAITDAGIGLAQTDILASDTQYAQAIADINATYITFGQAQVDINATTTVVAQAQTTVQGNVFGLSQADINQTYSQSGLASVWIVAPAIAVGQSQVYLSSFDQTVLGQSIADIKFEGTIGTGQSNAKIRSFGAKVFGQSSVSLKASYASFGLSALSVKTTYYIVGQAKATIRGNVFAQSKTSIKAISIVYASSSSWILAKYIGIASSTTTIKASGFVTGQSLAKIKGINVPANGNVQTSIKTVYRVTGLATVDIKTKYVVFGAARSLVDYVRTTYGQAGAKLNGIGIGSGQAFAVILKPSAFGLSRAFIRSLNIGSLKTFDKPSLQLKIYDKLIIPNIVENSLQLTTKDSDLTLGLIDRNLIIKLTDKTY